MPVGPLCATSNPPRSWASAWRHPRAPPCYQPGTREGKCLFFCPPRSVTLGLPNTPTHPRPVSCGFRLCSRVGHGRLLSSASFSCMRMGVWGPQSHADCGQGPGAARCPSTCRPQVFRADRIGGWDREHGLQERGPALSPACCVTLGQRLPSLSLITELYPSPNVLIVGETSHECLDRC